MKKRIAIALASVLVYLLLLLGLTTAEGAAGGSIRTLGDALWYSLVTMSTVGYGDLAPITPAGRLIGALFVLLSLGVLAFLLGMALILLTGRGLPGLRLALARKRRWYVFSERGAAAEALADSLSRAHPDAMMIFCTAQGPGGARVISVAYDVKTLCGSRCFRRGERFILLMAEDEAQNREQAAALAGMPAAVYCRSEETAGLPDVSFFDPREACARLYWQQHPLLQSEHDVVLLGDGRFAQALLNQAVLVNCMTPWHTAAYHLFGDWTPYLRLHHGLAQALAVGHPEDGKDALLPGGDFPEPALLERADRFILCDDDPQKNAERARTLSRWFVCPGQVDAMTDEASAPCRRFGSVGELYTEERVMKLSLDRAARAMHETYRQNTGGAIPPWEALNAFLKRSNRAVADHLPVKRMLLEDCHASWEGRDAALTQQCRRNEHDRWLRFHSLYNWRYAPVRDNALRRHPCMIPFDQLSVAEQAKDDYAWEQMTRLESEEKRV